MEVKPIKDDAAHAAALRRIEQLWDASPGSPEADELDVLATLVDAYEEGRFPIDAPDPIAALKFRMEQAGYSQAQLGDVIGSRSRASEILRKKRPLTLEMIWRIHEKWRVPAEALIKPYRTQAARPARAPKSRRRKTSTPRRPP